MTTPLSSLLAATLNQSTGTTSPTSLPSQVNVDAATQGASRSTSPAIANAALSQAATLDNAAKVIVERLPERVLSITVTPNNVSSAAQVLNVALPAEVSAKLSNQAINNALTNKVQRNHSFLRQMNNLFLRRKTTHPCSTGSVEKCLCL